ncbi:MAG: galactosyltransferase-related protein, partial [Nitrospira sp.]
RLPIHEWGWEFWFQAWMRRDINRLIPLITLPDGAFRKWSPGRWKGIKTCNLSIWRSDLLRVNGVDESYEGWGLEDSDLVIRLLRSGVRHKTARYAAPVFHLWHREQSRSGLDENRKRLERVLTSHDIWAIKGLDRYAVRA